MKRQNSIFLPLHHARQAHVNLPTQNEGHMAGLCTAFQTYPGADGTIPCFVQHWFHFQNHLKQCSRNWVKAIKLILNPEEETNPSFSLSSSISWANINMMAFREKKQWQDSKTSTLCGGGCHHCKNITAQEWERHFERKGKQHSFILSVSELLPYRGSYDGGAASRPAQPLRAGAAPPLIIFCPKTPQKLLSHEAAKNKPLKSPVIFTQSQESLDCF